MTFQGHVEKGCVVFDEPVNLPDGTAVVVELIDARSASNERTSASMYDRWKSVVGIAKYLPPDASTEIDDVLYGRTDE